MENLGCEYQNSTREMSHSVGGWEEEEEEEAKPSTKILEGGLPSLQPSSQLSSLPAGGGVKLHSSNAALPLALTGVCKDAK